MVTLATVERQKTAELSVVWSAAADANAGSRTLRSLIRMIHILPRINLANRPPPPSVARLFPDGKTPQCTVTYAASGVLAREHALSSLVQFPGEQLLT